MIDTSFLRCESQPFYDRQRAYFLLDSIAFHGSQAGISNERLMFQILNLAQAALYYSGDNQKEVLRIMDDIYATAATSPQSKLRLLPNGWFSERKKDSDKDPSRVFLSKIESRIHLGEEPVRVETLKKIMYKCFDGRNGKSN